ncbi:hypothetical protein MHU86_17959 [Fragilaria crotonensis]|nr:hypothetical protein MHU86_17959 [Fragilaria crotonensis]
MASVDDCPSILILRSVCSDGAPPDSSFPLWCDLTVLPEIHESNEAIIRVRQQGFNPCGIDNVLLLEGLKQGQGYLMSLSNCFARLVDNDERFEVTSSPATFFFSLQSMPSFQENSGIMINTKQPSTELHVAFDVTSGKDHLVADQEEVEELPPIIDGDDTLQACQPPVDTHAQVLRLLETLAEREARDVDIMLSGLALAVVVLLGIYGWTVHTVAKKLSTVKIIKNEAMIATQRTNLPPARSTTTSASTVDTATRRSKTVEPPMDSVIVDRTGVNYDNPPLIDEPRDHASTPKFAPVDSLSSKLMASPRHLDVFTKPPVSPCSQLEKDWEQKKAARRSRRRIRQPLPSPCLMPIPVPEDTSMVDASSFKPRKRILPVSECCKEEPTSDDAPFCPTSVSDESFLSDYW